MSKLFDTSITSIGDSLMKSLHWINTNYGRTERRKTEKLERNKTTSYYYPAKYTGNGEYINTLPNDTSKNSVFFSVEDAQEFVSTNAYAVLKGRVNAIFWVDLRTIFPNVELSNTEEIKDEIIFAFSKCPNVQLLNIYEQPDNVFNKYTIKDVPVQFLMFPYYGVRFELNVIARQVCNNYSYTKEQGVFNEAHNESFDIERYERHNGE